MNTTTTRQQVEQTPLTLNHAVSIFLHHHTQTLSPSYGEWLHKKLGHLVAYLGEDTKPEEITIVSLDLWYSTILDQPWSNAYKAGYARAVKTFFTWLGSRRYIKSNPAALLRPVSIPELPPKSISDAAARALLSLTAELPRDQALIRFMLFTGARAHEVTGLTRDRLYLSERYAIVEGKGKRGVKQHRPVIFDPMTQEALRVHLAQAPASVYVFTSQKIGCDGKPLSPNALRLLLNRLRPLLAEKFGIREDISPHRLRHWWATKAIRSGGNLSMVQDQMGHKDPRTTRHYAKFTPNHLRDSYDQAFDGRL